MPVTKFYDTVNGLIYNAIGTGDWAGAEGVSLRSQGWRYCGFGTGGIYIAAAGQPCSTKIASPQPNVLPPAPQDQQGGASAPQVVRDTACGSCRHTTTTQVTTQGNLGAVQQPGTKVIVKKSGLPWWVILLALLLASKVVGDE